MRVPQSKGRKGGSWATGMWHRGGTISSSKINVHLALWLKNYRKQLATLDVPTLRSLLAEHADADPSMLEHVRSALADKLDNK